MGTGRRGVIGILNFPLQGNVHLPSILFLLVPQSDFHIFFTWLVYHFVI